MAAMDWQTKKDFYDDGFCCMNAILPEAMVFEAEKLLKQTLVDALPNGLPKNTDDAVPWVKAKNQLRSHPTLLNLVNETRVKSVLGDLLGGVYKASACQVACRFPGERCEPNSRVIPEEWYADWHIDGFTGKDHTHLTKHYDFSCLVGIWFSDNLTEYHGNFSCFPGAHQKMEDYFKKYEGPRELLKHGFPHPQQELSLSPPRQVLVPRGGVVFSHYMTPHVIAPNVSDNIRYTVFYRMVSGQRPSASKNNCSSTLQAIWREWAGMKVLFGKDGNLLDVPPEEATVEANSDAPASPPAEKPKKKKKGRLQ
eukprot:TRINITY_DN46233_c0_g2_i1.p1 TRINITY_DN46233_c0_g2~~TRINITY_DN46233_c0_g2_i1.p1  ORF type:complete len:324 (+),score=37.38 TRINITY_DN46233_c0_g2_i1:45-974(+)